MQRKKASVLSRVKDLAQEQRTRVREVVQEAMQDGTLQVQFAIKEKNRMILKLEEDRRRLREEKSQLLISSKQKLDRLQEMLVQRTRELATVKSAARASIAELAVERDERLSAAPSTPPTPQRSVIDGALQRAVAGEKAAQARADVAERALVAERAAHTKSRMEVSAQLATARMEAAQVASEAAQEQAREAVREAAVGAAAVAASDAAERTARYREEMAAEKEVAIAEARAAARAEALAEARTATAAARAEARAEARVEARAEARLGAEAARLEGAAAERAEAARAVVAKEAEWERYKAKAVAQLKALQAEKGQLADQVSRLALSAKAAAVGATVEAATAAEAHAATEAGLREALRRTEVESAQFRAQLAAAVSGPAVLGSGRTEGVAESIVGLRMATEEARAEGRLEGAAAERAEAARAVVAKEAEWERYKAKAVAQLKALQAEKGQLAERAEQSEGRAQEVGVRLDETQQELRGAHAELHQLRSDVAELTSQAEDGKTHALEPLKMTWHLCVSKRTAFRSGAGRCGRAAVSGG